MNRLRELHDAGVSIWLDTLSRDLLDSGRFAELIAASAVTGATSNPTIFAKALAESSLYDAQLAELAASGVRDPQALFFAVALDDIRRAADLLRRIEAGEPVGDDLLVPLYVEGLIAPGAINTMPEATLRAFGDHGRVSTELTADADLAQQILRQASGAGVDLEAITRELERAGVSAFCDSYRELLSHIDSVRRRVTVSRQHAR